MNFQTIEAFSNVLLSTMIAEAICPQAITEKCTNRRNCISRQLTLNANMLWFNRKKPLHTQWALGYRVCISLPHIYTYVGRIYMHIRNLPSVVRHSFDSIRRMCRRNIIISLVRFALLHWAQMHDTTQTYHTPWVASAHLSTNTTDSF